MSSGAANIEQPAGSGPDSRQYRLQENGHYVGTTAAAYIDKLKPIWGDSKVYGPTNRTDITTGQIELEIAARQVVCREGA